MKKLPIKLSLLGENINRELFETENNKDKRTIYYFGFQKRALCMYYVVLVDHSAYHICVTSKILGYQLPYHTGYVLNLSDCSANSQRFFSNVHQP